MVDLERAAESRDALRLFAPTAMIGGFFGRLIGTGVGFLLALMGYDVWCVAGREAFYAWLHG